MQLQPFELFRLAYVDRLIQLKKLYLVTQTYERGENLEGLECRHILLTDYEEEELAIQHYKAVRTDRYAAIIDLKNNRHKRVLLDMLEEGSPYRLYWAVVSSTKELESRVNNKYKEQVRRYINRFTDWKIARGTTIRPIVQLVFGELYLVLEYSSHTLTVKFEEIERA